MKKIINYLALAVFFVYLISLSSAYTTEHASFNEGIFLKNGNMELTETPVNGINVLGFVCSDSDCSSVSANLWNGQTFYSSTNKITLSYPAFLQSPYGYLVFSYKEGYSPAFWRNNYQQANDGGEITPPSFYLSKFEECSADISEYKIEKTTSKVIVSFNVTTPSLLERPNMYLPEIVKKMTYVDTNVTFILEDENQIYLDSKIINIPSSINLIKEIDIPTIPGEYTLKIITNPVDGKCLSSVEDIKTEVIVVEEPENVTSPITINVNSPSEMYTYDTTNILVDIEAENATNVWFSGNDNLRIDYYSPLFVNFTSGKNVLKIYANNEYGDYATKNVTFFVVVSNQTDTNQTDNNQTNQTDITAPGLVKNLQVLNKGTDFIEVSWENPDDADFDSNFVYLDGSLLNVTSDEKFKFSGLSENTEYLITIKSRDFSGNINQGKSILERTDKNQDENNDNNGDDSEDDWNPSRPPRYINSTEESSVSPINPFYLAYYEDSKDSFNLSGNENTGLNKNWLMVFGIGSIVLLILILILFLF